MNGAARIPGLDGLRGIAAITVMLFHFNIFFLPQARLTDLAPFLDHAYLGVDLFFLLSGFVMAHVHGRALASNWRANWLRFATARFARIYPLFAITTLAMIILVGISDAPIKGLALSARTLALQPLLMQQWSGGANWNYPSWSISTEAEAYIYFIFAAGLLLTGKYPRVMGAGCVFILAALSVHNAGSLNYFHGVPALFRTIAGFSLGILLHRAHAVNIGRRRGWAAILAVLFTGLAAITRMDFLTVCAFGCLIYYVATATGAFGRLLNSAPSVALGNWSYSVYLWHAPTHFAVMAAFAANRHPVGDLGLFNARLLMLATAAVVVGVAAVHYKYVETPLRRLFLRAASSADLGPARVAH